MSRFTKFYYIYPPRPKNAVNPEELNFWDNGSMLGQVKTNGSNAVIFMNEQELYVFNRHGQKMTNVNLDKNELRNLYSGSGWMVINGEYLNKSKRDETEQTFNNKLVIFDVLVHNGIYLLGKSFRERIEIMEEMWNSHEIDKQYMNSISENIFIVKTYENGFKELFDTWTKIDMVEGLVLKRANAKLEIGSSENNNYKSQIKSRKVTKNYKF